MHMNLDQVREYLPFLIPLIVVELVLLVYALRHILTHRNYRIGNRTMWVLVSILVQIIGPVLYFVIGKEKD